MDFPVLNTALDIQKTRKRILGFLFFYALLMPTFHSILGSLGAGVVNIGLIVLAIIVVLLNGLQIRFCHSKEKKIFQIFFWIMTYYFLILFINQIVFLPNVSISDIIEYHRPVLYLMSFLLPLLLIREQEELESLFKIFIWSFFVILIISAIQYIGFGRRLGLLYVKELNTGSRLSMPFINPYDFAYFMNIFTAYFIFKFINTRRFLYVLPAVLSVFLIFLTQSRGGFVGVIFLTLILVPGLLFFKHFNSVIRLKLNRSFFLLFLFLFALTVSSAFVLVTQKESRFRYLWNGLNFLTSSETNRSKSLTARAGQLKNVVEEAQENIYVAFFGKGSLKVEAKNLESVYAYYGTRYGLMGFLLLFCTPLAIGIYYAFCNALHFRQSSFWLALCSWYLLLPAIGFTNNFNEQMRLSFFYYFFMGVSLRAHFMKIRKKTIRPVLEINAL